MSDTGEGLACLPSAVHNESPDVLGQQINLPRGRCSRPSWECEHRPGPIRARSGSRFGIRADSVRACSSPPDLHRRRRRRRTTHRRRLPRVATAHEPNGGTDRRRSDRAGAPTLVRTRSVASTCAHGARLERQGLLGTRGLALDARHVGTPDNPRRRPHGRGRRSRCDRGLPTWRPQLPHQAHWLRCARFCRPRS